MKYPKVGSIVIVKWFDAYTLDNATKGDLDRKNKAVMKSAGEFMGYHDVIEGGKSIRYIDLLHCHSDAGDEDEQYDVIHIPEPIIFKIVEHK